MTFEYTPWTPPAVEGTGRPGAQKKPNVHEAALIANLDTDTWTQFVVQPAGSNPDDVYAGSINGHTRDLTRAAKANNAKVTFQVFKVLPDGTEERWLKTRDKPEFMEDGATAIIRFYATRKTD